MEKQLQPRIGVLLVNLGSPTTCTTRAVRRYLKQFLTDGRVIKLFKLWRNLLVRGVIIPLRYRTSTEAYRRIWTKEGAPLLIHGHSVQKKLGELLGERFVVALAMRYQ